MDEFSGSAAVTMQDHSWQLYFENETVITISVTYPVVSVVGARWVQERINSRIQAQVMEFYRYASDTLYHMAVQEYQDSKTNDFPFRPYDTVLQYNITFNQDCHLSMYRDQYQFTGGAHGNTVRSSDTWSLQTGRKLPLSQFYHFGENYRKTILDEILRQADASMAGGSGVLFEDYRTLILRYFDPESYYLLPTGIAVYFQQYEIAPYVAGIVVFTIPYEVKPSCVGS